MTVGEWDERQLCADGSCIGLIGPTGTCKVCGRAAANWGDERKRGLVADVTPSGPEDEHEHEHANEDADEGDGTEAPAAAEGTDASARALCPDGACIGLIGPDGRCKVCGKAAAAAVARPSEAAADRLDEPDAERKLCPDGACVGVIGDSGTCKVCGKAAE